MMIKESVLDYILKENDFETERSIYEKEKIVKAIFKKELKNEYKDFDRFIKIKIERLKDIILDQKDYINTLEECAKELEKTNERYDYQIKKLIKNYKILITLWASNIILWTILFCKHILGVI